jgi:succinate dehydrogenase / fumarate reductase, cytochrome b subunit
MATVTTPRSARPPVQPKPKFRLPWPLSLYQSTVGKKWVMALTGIGLIGFVLAHLFGNIKFYLGESDINLYGEALRDLGGHLLPRTWALWALRFGLIACFVLHIHAAASLTLTNRRARPVQYQSKRDYQAATFASRSMRWTGVIFLLYLIFHLADLTWGTEPLANAEFVRGQAYANLYYSLDRPVVAVVYAIANIALAIHLFHGAQAMFRSLGVSNPRTESLRQNLARSIAGIVLIGNLSFPITVQLGLVDEPECVLPDGTRPPAEQCHE